MMSKKNMGWPFYAAVQISVDIVSASSQLMRQMTTSVLCILGKVFRIRFHSQNVIETIVEQIYADKAKIKRRFALFQSLGRRT